MVSKTLIGSSVTLWVLPRPGIKEWQRSKIHRRGPHPLEPGVKGFLELGAIFDHPPVNGGVVHVNPTFFHEFLDVACAQRVRHIPAHPHENDLWGEMGPFEADRHGPSPPW